MGGTWLLVDRVALHMPAERVPTHAYNLNTSSNSTSTTIHFMHFHMLYIFILFIYKMDIYSEADIHKNSEVQNYKLLYYRNYRL